jgi:hypothetical protein
MHIFTVPGMETYLYYHSDSTSPQLKQLLVILIRVTFESDPDTTSSSKQPNLDSDLNIYSNESNPVVPVGGCEIP